MSDFKSEAAANRKITSIPEDDHGITVADALVLLEGSDLKEGILAALDIAEIAGDTIQIPGARTLVDSVMEVDSHYEKFDLSRRYEQISILRSAEDGEYFEKDVELGFDATEEGWGQIVASPAYAAQPTFLEKTGSMRSYARTLIDNGRIDMIFHDLEQMRTIYNAEQGKHHHSYRIIKDRDSGKYYYRAITSTQHYKDYNIKLSVFAFLVAIHRLMQNGPDKYRLSQAIHTDSRIKALFEKTGTLHKSPLGRVKFLIELRNNEVREGAVKFSGVCAIVYDNQETNEATTASDAAPRAFDEYTDENEEQADSIQRQSILLVPRPNKLRYKIESIKHNVGPQKALPRMLVGENVTKVEQQIYSDLAMVADVKTLSEILAIVKNKVKYLTTDSVLGGYKAQLQRVIPENLSNVEELLRMAGKIDLVVPNKDANAKEQLSYMFFEAIVERNRPGFKKTDKEEEAE